MGAVRILNSTSTMATVQEVKVESIPVLTKQTMSIPPEWKSDTRSLLHAGLLISTWIATHIYALWILDALRHPMLGAAVLFWQSWLSVGLFVTGHDCMHGSLAPHYPRLNRFIGQLVLRLYFYLITANSIECIICITNFRERHRIPISMRNIPSRFSCGMSSSW